MDFKPTARTRLKRIPERGQYDRETIYQVLDQARICHVGIAPGGSPLVIPTLYARLDDDIVFHGAKASRLLKYVQNGGEVCITVTQIEALVLARSVFHHSMNYRSVVVLGTGRLLQSRREKLRALEAISENLLPGRWADARGPSEKELQATSVVAVPIQEASAKVRSGPPVDDEEDYALPVWAGVLPIHRCHAEPLADPRLPPDVPLPDYLRAVIGLAAPPRSVDR